MLVLLSQQNKPLRFLQVLETLFPPLGSGSLHDATGCLVLIETLCVLSSYFNVSNEPSGYRLVLKSFPKPLLLVKVPSDGGSVTLRRLSQANGKRLRGSMRHSGL